MIKFDHAFFGYDSASPTIKDISFEIKKGEFVAIIGENGAGKSTVSKLIDGLIKPKSGTVTVAGMDTAKTRTSKLARHIGFLFQNPDHQICQNTVRKEIRFGLELVSENPENIDIRVEQIIEEFGFDGDKDPFTLSRGERQRVALASTIAVEPDILILDEPTTGLDYIECMHVMNDVRELNQKGVTVVMVCHDMEVTLDFAQRILVISDGKLIADGKTTDIFRNACVMEKASLIPPQITELAIRLGDGFENVNSVTEMVFAIEKGLVNK
ncbi:MAG: energy-coupling factor ABC transporter ATP-binding protein [Clostridiales bacterium]|nr:energy-coupling factor ABC transporter ATP-binding protein [Clostridiales bacterium]